MAKSTCQVSLASISTGARWRSSPGWASSWIDRSPLRRAAASQSGVPAVRAWFIVPNRSAPPVILVTWLCTVRGGFQLNG
jgi:hypothetical protein